jgi:hypothetical protein
MSNEGYRRQRHELILGSIPCNCSFHPSHEDRIQWFNQANQYTAEFKKACQEKLCIFSSEAAFDPKDSTEIRHESYYFVGNSRSMFSRS